jgi:hypothetical protein
LEESNSPPRPCRSADRPSSSSSVIYRVRYTVHRSNTRHGRRSRGFRRAGSTAIDA